MSIGISNGYDKRCLEVIWDALHEWQDYSVKEINRYEYDAKKSEALEDNWDNICTAMAWIQEDLEEIKQENKEVSKC
jgi:hypothetical protein